MNVLTALMGFMLASPEAPIAWLLTMTLLGTALVAAGASALNMVMERRTDALMRRTHDRPVPAGRLAASEAAAFGLAVGWDLDRRAAASGLASFGGVPGRREVLARGQPFGVVIDFAHTPKSIDAVAGELESLVGPNGGSVISVFGSSGERDVAKRPLMGEAAARRSRLVIITEDDSRGEDPDSIFEQIAAGAEKAGKRRGEDLLIIPDRRQAIAEAFRRAQPGDVVLLAGKGHETWNMGPHGPEPWSDREAALALLELGTGAERSGA
jgi:UDP-N-acetylmuramoyl-L-alanyl-D-glutamate--2,6-diaminopimelate ligase